MYRVDFETYLEDVSKYNIYVHCLHRNGSRNSFMTIVDPDMYHDIVLLVVCSFVSVVSVLAVARALLCVSCLCW